LPFLSPWFVVNHDKIIMGIFACVNTKTIGAVIFSPNRVVGKTKGANFSMKYFALHLG